jgi:hypothetical protein
MSTYQSTFKKSKVTDATVKKFVTDVSDMLKLNTAQAIMAVKDPAKYKLKFDSTTTLANRIKENGDLFKNISTNKLLSSSLKNKAAAHNIDLTSAKLASRQQKMLPILGISNISTMKMIYAKIENYSRETVHRSDNPKANKKLQFNLHEVKCVDETNPEPFGTDNMWVFGTALNDKGVAAPFDYFKAGNFDDNEKKVFSPSKKLAIMDLDSTYPKVMAVSIGLVEKDTDSKLASALKSVYAAVEEEVKGILESVKAELTVIAGSIGAFFGGPVGTAIASALAYVFASAFDAFVDWIKDMVTPDDDFFEVQTATLILEKPTSVFEGNSTSSPIQTMRYQAHDGTYDLKYNWEILN